MNIVGVNKGLKRGQPIYTIYKLGSLLNFQIGEEDLPPQYKKRPSDDGDGSGEFLSGVKSKTTKFMHRKVLAEGNSSVFKPKKLK